VLRHGQYLDQVCYNIVRDYAAKLTDEEKISVLGALLKIKPQVAFKFD